MMKSVNRKTKHLKYSKKKKQDKSQQHLRTTTHSHARHMRGRHAKHKKPKYDSQTDLKRKIVILVITIMLAISATQFFFSLYKVVDVKRIQMNISVMDSMGFSLDKDTLHFGGMPPGNCGTRALWVENKYNKSLIVDIRRYGEMADWVEIANQSFVIRPLEKTKVKFGACVPYNTSYGNYTGTIAVIMKRP